MNHLGSNLLLSFIFLGNKTVFIFLVAYIILIVAYILVTQVEFTRLTFTYFSPTVLHSLINQKDYKSKEDEEEESYP